MRSSALKKTDIDLSTLAPKLALVSDTAADMSFHEIARQAQEAAHLPGNHDSGDYEQFLLKYDLRGCCDFA